MNSGMLAGLTGVADMVVWSRNRRLEWNLRREVLPWIPRPSKLRYGTQVLLSPSPYVNV